MWFSELSLGRSLRIGAVLMVTFTSAVLYAQVDTASIVGTVKDSTGALIQSASVTVQNVATGESQTVKVSDAGTYVFPYLRVGNYTVSAEAGGFKKEIRDGIVLDVQDRKQVDFTMQVGSNSQEVTVTDSAPLLQTQNADVGTVVDSQQATDLPLNGRRYDQLSLLTAGVNPSSASFQSRAEGVFSVNGNSSTENNSFWTAPTTIPIRRTFRIKAPKALSRRSTPWRNSSCRRATTMLSTGVAPVA